MRSKVLPKPRRPVALSVDAEEVAVSVEVIVAAVAVAAVAGEDLLGHLLLFVSSFL